jgi:hypothetical protein
MELKEERWFELSAKWKDKIRNSVSVAVCSIALTLLLFRIKSKQKFLILFVSLKS